VILLSIIAFIATQATLVVVMGILLRDALPTMVFNPFLGMCVSTQKTKIMKGIWAANCIFEAFIFLLVCINALSRPREPDILLTKVLYRDGICFFLAMSALGWMNVVLISAAPVYKTTLGVFSGWAISMTIVSRMMMDQRQAELVTRGRHGESAMALKVWVTDT